MTSSQLLNHGVQTKVSYTVRCSERTEHGKTYAYTLYGNGPMGDSYRISVTCGEETADGLFTASFSEAASLFERIVQGVVPPYILAEILEDFEKKGE